MIWAILAALGVGIISMTLFGARLTRPNKDGIVEDLNSPDGPEHADPDDPWAAWKPRSFEELDRPRPRLWPVLSAITGLVMVGAGFAGARQTLWDTTAPASSATEEIATPMPFTVEVEAPPTPTPLPTPTPVAATPAPTPRPRAASTPAPPAATAAPAAQASQAPTLTGSASCSGGRLTLNYTATANDSTLSWLTVYLNGETARGGPVSGQNVSGSYETSATSGKQDLEVAVEDAEGRTSRRQFQTTCP